MWQFAVFRFCLSFGPNRKTEIRFCRDETNQLGMYLVVCLGTCLQHNSRRDDSLVLCLIIRFDSFAGDSVGRLRLCFQFETTTTPSD